jgi:uncharacterized protein (UPF0332 family)
MRERQSEMEWCARQKKGIRLTTPNSDLAEVYLKKSRSALNMLSSAIEKNELDWILDTSYYAKYFAAYSLFMKAGIKSEIHDCTIATLNFIFVKQNIISQELASELKKSKELRVDSLYYDKELGKDEILFHAKKAPDYHLELKSIIEQLTDNKIVLIREEFKRLTRTNRGK